MLRVDPWAKWQLALWAGWGRDGSDLAVGPFASHPRSLQTLNHCSRPQEGSSGALGLESKNLSSKAPLLPCNFKNSTRISAGFSGKK